LVLALFASTAAAQDGAVEFAVKATYVYKFAPFVEWPPGTYAAATSPVVVCVVGNDEVARLVGDAARGQTVGEHPIEVRYLPTATGVRDCHIAYIAGRDSEARRALLDNIKGAPVLPITDAPADARDTGIINFVIRDNRVRFEIDLDAAARNQLTISSKLLSLATKVRARS